MTDEKSKASIVFSSIVYCSFVQHIFLTLFTPISVKSNKMSEKNSSSCSSTDSVEIEVKLRSMQLQEKDEFVIKIKRLIEDEKATMMKEQEDFAERDKDEKYERSQRNQGYEIKSLERLLKSYKLKLEREAAAVMNYKHFPIQIGNFTKFVCILFQKEGAH